MLNAIAVVDHPCNEHAVVTLLKRRPEPEIAKPAFQMTPEGQAIVLKACEAMQSAIDRQSAALAALSGTKPERKAEKMHSDPFMSCVEKIQKRDACTRSQALMRAADEEPELLAEYRSQGASADPRAELIAKGHENRARIDREVRKVMAREGVNRIKALQTLRDKSPEVFEDTDVEA